MSIEIPLNDRLTVEQAIAAANAAKRSAQQALADIPAVIDAEVGPASAPYITQAVNAKDDAVAAKTASEAARDDALATERRIRTQSLGAFADDAAAVAWAAAQTPPITIVTGASYLNTTSDIFRYAVVSAGPTITWHDVTEDEAAQAALATASATAAQTALSDLLTRYVGPFNSTPTYVGDTAPWSVGALYWNKLQGKFFVWSGSTWTATDATAQQAKIDAEAAASSAAQIAVGLSYDEYTLDGVSALDQGAVISFPKGLFVLNGNRVSLDTLLAASTAQKRILGPDGNYLTSGANTIAEDWSSGRRRGLIEGIGATNLWPYSEALEATYIGNQFSVANSANSLFGTLNRATLTATLANAAVYSGYGYLSVVAGDVVTFTAAIKNGTGQFVNGGLYGVASGWGADGDTTCVVLSGPGTVTLNVGGLWDFSGVTSDTVIRWTRTYRATESAVPFLYTNCAIGQTVSVGCIQLERGYGSSYTPTGASATARPPDVVTAASGLLALLTAANATLAMRYTDPNAANTAGVIGSTSGPAMVLDWDQNTGIILDNAGANVLSIPGATNANTRGLAVSYTAGSIKAALNGASPVKIAGKTLFSASDSGIQFCKPYASIYGGNFSIDEIVVWPIFADHDASLQAQARVYS